MQNFPRKRGVPAEIALFLPKFGDCCTNVTEGTLTEFSREV